MHTFSIEASQMPIRSRKVWLYKSVISLIQNIAASISDLIFLDKGDWLCLYLCFSALQWASTSEIIIINYCYYFYLCMFENTYFIKYYHQEWSLVHNVSNIWSVKASNYCSVAFLIQKLYIRITNDSLNDNSLQMLINPFIVTPIFYSFPCSYNKKIIPFCNKKKKKLCDPGPHQNIPNFYEEYDLDRCYYSGNLKKNN